MHIKPKISSHISIVICTYNGGDRLKNVVDFILSNSFHPFEIIIVDNNSDVFTQDVIQGIVAGNSSDIKIHAVREEQQGLMYARLKGVMVAKCEYICFVDDDNYLDASFIRILSDLLSESNIDYVGGRTILYESLSYINKSELVDDLSLYAIGKPHRFSGWLTSKSPCLWGAGLTVKRESFIATAKLAPYKLVGRVGKLQLSGDDSEICLRLFMLGYKGYYSDSLLIYHDVDARRFKSREILRTVKGFGMAYPTIKYYKNIINGGPPILLSRYFRLSFEVIYYFSGWWVNHLWSFLMIRRSIAAAFYNGAFTRLIVDGVDSYPVFDEKLFIGKR